MSVTAQEQCSRLRFPTNASRALSWRNSRAQLPGPGFRVLRLIADLAITDTREVFTAQSRLDLRNSRLLSAGRWAYGFMGSDYAS